VPEASKFFWASKSPSKSPADSGWQNRGSAENLSSRPRTPRTPYSSSLHMAPSSPVHLAKRSHTTHPGVLSPVDPFPPPLPTPPPPSPIAKVSPRQRPVSPASPRAGAVSGHAYALKSGHLPLQMTACGCCLLSQHSSRCRMTATTTADNTGKNPIAASAACPRHRVIICDSQQRKWQGRGCVQSVEWCSPFHTHANFTSVAAQFAGDRLRSTPAPAPQILGKRPLPNFRP